MDHLLEIKNLKKYFPIQKGIFKRTVGYVKAIDGVTFNLAKGETLGLVGESGCGKTTAGRCILGLIKPTDGQVLFDKEKVDLCKLSRKEIKAYRPRMQMIFQDPYSSLNPRMTVGDIVAEPLRVNKRCKKNQIQDRVEELLKKVGLSKHAMRCYPHAFSGGQRQRIGIARSLALEPELIVADEPVSALDVSVQAQILNLLAQLKAEHNLSYIFIAHDLSVIEHISDRIVVMYLGKIMEISPAKKLYKNPGHPYTETLLSAIPIADPRLQKSKKHITLQGDVPDPANPPSGCVFRTRCQYAKDICSKEIPQLKEVDDETAVTCHFCKELSLAGI